MQPVPPEGGFGKICPLCKAYNSEDAKVCGDGKPKKGCGAALPTVKVKFAPQAPTKGRPTVGNPSHINQQNQFVTYNNPMSRAASVMEAELPVESRSVDKLREKVQKQNAKDRTWALLDPD